MPTETSENTETVTTNQVVKKPGQTGSNINVPAAQLQLAVSKTGLSVETIIAQQNRFPAEISGYTITSGFIRNSGDYHGGFDISTDVGTKITLKKDVIFRGNLVDSKGVNAGYGNYVLIEYNGKGIVLGHLSEQYKGTAKIGQTIKSGELIAKTGNTGKSSGPHLHFHTYQQPNLGAKHALPLDYALELLTLSK
jgi:murein DD-endopeptidase MepM/ murein hydrolase activator NlpD